MRDGPGAWGEWKQASAWAQIEREGEKGNIMGAIQQMRSDGFAQLAGYGEEIMAGGAEDAHMKWKDVEVWKKQAWQAEVWEHGRWSWNGCKGNVGSWNLGPLGYVLSITHIQELLDLGMPVVCCQELRFPKGHQRRVKKELEALNRNYICFIEVGLDRKYAESQREDHGWNSKLNFAVATFLHTGIFDAKKSSRKEWASTIQTHSMAHMARGRVQWIDAVTKQGKTLFIVNMHQATAAYVELQELVWRAIGAKIQERGQQAGMIVGDLNAGWPGHRTGYAESTKKSLSRVDEQLRTLVEEYQGTLISTKTASRVDVHEGRRAKLDHIIIWGMTQHEEWGSADWAGAAEHDHARTMFRVGEELLGPRRLEVKQPAEEGKNKRLHPQIMENIVDRLNQERGDKKKVARVCACVYLITSSLDRSKVFERFARR